MLSLTEFRCTGDFTALPGNAFTQNPRGTGAGAGAERVDCPSLRICLEKGWKEQGAEALGSKGHPGCLSPHDTYSSAQAPQERLTLGWGAGSRAPGACWGCARGAPAVSPSTQTWAGSSLDASTGQNPPQSNRISFCSGANY